LFTMGLFDMEGLCGKTAIRNNNRRLNGLVSKVLVFKQMCVNWAF
jgi:hypothetical protein